MSKLGRSDIEEASKLGRLDTMQMFGFSVSNTKKGDKYIFLLKGSLIISAKDVFVLKQSIIKMNAKRNWIDANIISLYYYFLILFLFLKEVYLNGVK